MSFASTPRARQSRVTRAEQPRNYCGVAPERCLKISTADLSAWRCLSNEEISDSIRAIAAINPLSTTGGATASVLVLAGNSSALVPWATGSPTAPAVAFLRYILDHLRNDQMLTSNSLASSLAGTPPVCNRCTASELEVLINVFSRLGLR